MRVVYYTKPYFLDCDLPLIRALKKHKLDLTVIIDLAPHSRQSNILNIQELPDGNRISRASCFKDFEELFSFLDNDSTYIINRRRSKQLAPSNLILNIKVFLMILRLKPMIIHSTINFGFPELFLYYFRRQTIVTQHDPFPHSGENGMQKRLFRKLCFKQVKNYIILNKSQKDEFIKRYEIESDRVLESQLSSYSALELYKNPNVIKERSTIIFFGRISPYKGLENLIEAVQRATKRLPDLKLIVAGRPSYNIDLAPLKESRNFEVHDDFIPAPKLVEFIQRAQLSVCPYLDATQSGVVMSSFALNTPVIASNVGGLSEYVTNNQTGVIIEPNDIDGLTEAIGDLLSAPSKIETMEKNIEEEWSNGSSSWSAIASDILRFYNFVSDNP